MDHSLQRGVGILDDRLDCVIVGHNDMDFDIVQKDLRKTRNYSGAYNDLKANSLLFGGRRITYMNLLNQILQKATGPGQTLHVCEMPQLGVAYLKSFLALRNFRVEAVNSFTYEKERLRDYLRGKPRAVAITTTFYVDHKPISEIVNFVRRHSSDSTIIVGGPYIYNLCSTESEKTLDFLFQAIGADVYIYDSQGELTLSRVLEQLHNGKRGGLSDVANLTYTLDQKVFYRTERCVENNEMDENIVHWASFDSGYFTPTVQTRTARSCAFSCAFCKYPEMAGPLKLTSLSLIEQELRAFQEAGVKNVVFIDDTFNVPLSRFKDILRMMIDNRFDFDWYSFFRCSNSDDEAYDLMEKSRCKGVFLGIESGDQRILKEMNKFANVDRYKYGIRMLKKRGIATFASIIVGYPGETLESVENTKAFLEEASPTFYRAELYYHYINVPIHQRARELGISGAGYSWRHYTMDWRTASDLAHGIYKTVKGPVAMPGYMFDFWSIPYLTGKGITIDQITRFATIAQSIMVASLDDSQPDTSESEKQMTAIFSPSGKP